MHSGLSEALMLQPRVLAALLAYLERRNASQDQIRKYFPYWHSSPRDPSVPCPNCYTFRGRHSGLTALHDKDGYMPLVCQVATRRTRLPCNRKTRLFAFEECGDVRKQLLATRLAHHTLVLVRSTMRAAFQSTNLTAPLRRLTYSAEPANVALCTGIRPLEIR